MGVPKEKRLNDNQKEALLKYMESHPNFGRGRLNAAQASQLYKNLWLILRDLLNSIPGATKDVTGWKEVWSTMRSEARQYACSNGVRKPTKTGGGEMTDSEDDDEEFYTDSPFINRIMAIIGWEAGMGLGVRDDLATSSDEDESVLKEQTMDKEKKDPLQIAVGNLLKVLNYTLAQPVKSVLLQGVEHEFQVGLINNCHLLQTTEMQVATRAEFNSLVNQKILRKKL